MMLWAEVPGTELAKEWLFFLFLEKVYLYHLLCLFVGQDVWNPLTNRLDHWDLNKKKGKAEERFDGWFFLSASFSLFVECGLVMCATVSSAHQALVISSLLRCCPLNTVCITGI